MVFLKGPENFSGSGADYRPELRGVRASTCISNTDALVKIVQHRIGSAAHRFPNRQG